MPLKVFIDFDGTIAGGNVAQAFFTRFDRSGSACEAILGRYRSGGIGAMEYFRQSIEAIGSLSDAEAKHFFRSREIDGSFKDFVAFCQTQGVEFSIVSDGMDYYIEEILREHSLEGIRLYTNHIAVHPEAGSDRSRLSISFPYSDAGYTRSACCARNIMLTRSGDDDVIAYIGDADHAPAQFADIVFARGSLQVFCQKENISFYPYSSFADVTRRCETLLAKKTLRTRRRAELRRQEVFMAEG